MRLIWTVIGWAKALWDWVSFGDAALAVLSKWFGATVVSGLTAALLGVWANATGYEVTLMGIGVFIALNLFLIQRHLAKRRMYRIGMQPGNAHCISYRINAEPKFYDNLYYLIVHNSDEQGRTLRNVSVRLHSFFDLPDTLPLLEKTTSTTDIRHGDIAVFQLGRIISEKRGGMPKFRKEDDPALADRLHTFRHNVPQGYISFQPADRWDHNFGSGGEDDHVWTLKAVITADDVVARTAKISVSLKEEHGVLVEPET